jgi:hypothetical protein
LASNQKLLVIVHRLDQARSVLSVAEGLMIDVELGSAPGASAYAGVGYLHALGQAVGRDLLIDCEVDPGLVMAGLRTGCKHLLFNGPADTRQRLKDMAEGHDATISCPADITAPRLALSPDDDEDAIRKQLAAFKA